MKPEHNTEAQEALAAFNDDPLEVVRCLAGVAAQRAKMTLEQRAAEPDPLDDWSPMVLAARRICLINGYNDDGSERPGFMERQAQGATYRLSQLLDVQENLHSHGWDVPLDAIEWVLSHPPK